MASSWPPSENSEMLISSTTSATTLAFGMPGGWEWIFILVIGLFAGLFELGMRALERVLVPWKGRN